jgi:opacity protein-like surface antigen
MAKIHVVLASLAGLALARPVSAGQGVTVGGVVAATSMESTTEVSVAWATGYRVNRVLGFGVEVMSVPTVKPDVSALDPSTLNFSSGGAPVVTSTSVSTSLVAGTEGGVIIFSTNVRIEIPTTARVIPYVIGGGGVASVKETFTMTSTFAVAAGTPIVIPPRAVTQSSTDLVLTLGGGVSTLVAAHVSIDLDLRYLRLMANRDLNVGRFGVGFSYRF